MNVRSSCDSLWRIGLDALAAAWPEFLRGDPKALHKVRIASRRIREALPIVAAGARPSKVRKLNRKVREITRQLGPVRDLDVKLGMIENNGTSGAPHRRALAIVRREVASRRRALREQLTKHDVADVDTLIKKLGRISETGGKGPEAWRVALAARMLRRSKQLKSAVDDTGQLYVPEPIHAVRIATKKLRYVLEIADEAGFASVRSTVRALKRHQEQLGRLQDLRSLLCQVRDVEGSSEGGARLAELTAYAESIEQESHRLHAEFVGGREALLKLTKEVRERLVPAATTQRLKPARVTTTRARAGGRFRAG
jgi:CHAD domain-containing protein